VNLLTKSNEYQRKFIDRLLVHRNNTIIRDGEYKGIMENARDSLWAQQDGHDMSPFGGGIFISQNGQGEYAQEAPQFSWDKRPQNFRDSLYYNLANRLKGWDSLAVDNNGDGKVFVSGL